MRVPIDILGHLEEFNYNPNLKNYLAKGVSQTAREGKDDFHLPVSEYSSIDGYHLSKVIARVNCERYKLTYNEFKTKILDAFSKIAKKEDKISYDKWRALIKMGYVEDNNIIIFPAYEAEAIPYVNLALWIETANGNYSVRIDNPAKSFLDIIKKVCPNVLRTIRPIYTISIPTASVTIGDNGKLIYNEGSIASDLLKTTINDNSCMSIRADTTITKKENKTMNIPAMNFECGLINDGKIQVSPYGIAVWANDDHFYAYNVTTGKTVDVTGFTFEFKNMIMKVPVALNQVQEGDIILHKGQPMFVDNVCEDSIDAIDILNSELKTVIPITNMFGFNFVTKIVSLINLGGASAPSPDQPFGNIVPYMMFSSMFNSDNNDEDGGDFMKMMAMASIFSGNNPFATMMGGNN